MYKFFVLPLLIMIDNRVQVAPPNRTRTNEYAFPGPSISYDTYVTRQEFERLNQEIERDIKENPEKHPGILKLVRAGPRQF